ncbi:MAG: hypothetical protein R6X29_11325 [Acidimicrobiia bacterium]
MGNAVLMVLRRPHLWGEAMRWWWSHRRRRWWGSAPFLPLPSTAHLDWRLATAYGRADHPLEAGDVVAYLAWRRRARRAR